MTGKEPVPDQIQIPKDIAAAYSSARPSSAEYRDFSASRRETRAEFYRRSHMEPLNPAKKREREQVEEEAAPAAEVAEPAIRSGGERQPSGEASLAPGVRLQENPFSEDWPQWLDPRSTHGTAQATLAPGTLLDAKERVASRWFALRNVFDVGEEASSALANESHTDLPAVAIFSFAGGVGKTSMVATLGRALAAHGERVLLVDATSFGMLPYYFGARELKPGVVRTFSPPEGSSGAPVHALTVQTQHSALKGEPDRLLEELRQEGKGVHRVVVDIQTAAWEVAVRLLEMKPTLIVPLLPDMSSVVSLRSMEETFAAKQDENGSGTRAFYILNQFDADLPLHLDVREILDQRLGERLLPFTIRRSPAVSEALAEGTTVMDYAPAAPVAEDYIRLANWLRNISSSALTGFRQMRWSEQ